MCKQNAGKILKKGMKRMTIEIFLKENGYSDVEINHEIVGVNIAKPENFVRGVLNNYLGKNSNL